MDVLKIFDHCPEILAIYRQLAFQHLSEKDFGSRRVRHDDGLAQVSSGSIIVKQIIIMVINEYNFY